MKLKDFKPKKDESDRSDKNNNEQNNGPISQVKKEQTDNDEGSTDYGPDDNYTTAELSNLLSNLVNENQVAQGDPATIPIANGAPPPPPPPPMTQNVLLSLRKLKPDHLLHGIWKALDDNLIPLDLIIEELTKLKEKPENIKEKVVVEKKVDRFLEAKRSESLEILLKQFKELFETKDIWEIIEKLVSKLEDYNSDLFKDPDLISILLSKINREYVFFPNEKDLDAIKRKLEDYKNDIDMATYWKYPGEYLIYRISQLSPHIKTILETFKTIQYYRSESIDIDPSKEFDTLNKAIVIATKNKNLKTILSQTLHIFNAVDGNIKGFYLSHIVGGMADNVQGINLWDFTKKKVKEMTSITRVFRRKDLKILIEASGIDFSNYQQDINFFIADFNNIYQLKEDNTVPEINEYISEWLDQFTPKKNGATDALTEIGVWTENVRKLWDYFGEPINDSPENSIFKILVDFDQKYRT